ncbi:hypothetical protein MCAP1_001969 [Malassezia caprae]|uniref:Uncharacterized protein n=1 Tax=Malassezia caprae TaxID=1381934 RepID=A0AAF0IWM4_9BASI|nr:hypothetical protein MCAP1_001969 [Malassezia caprae]
MLVDDMYKRLADHLLLHAPDVLDRALLEQSVPLGRRWLQVLPRFGALSLQDYDMSVGLQTLRHDRVRDVLYKHVQRNAHVEVEREALIVPGRQERSDLRVRGLHAGPGPETHYDLFIREVTGSSKERNGHHKVTMKPTGRAHEYMWEWQAPEKRAQQDEQITQTLGEKRRKKERNYSVCYYVRAIGLSASGLQIKGFRDTLRAFGQGLTEIDRAPAREQ